MKALIKFFSLAVIAMAVNVANAQVATTTIQAVQKSTIGKKFLTDLLGADAAVSAQAAAQAITKLGAVEAAAVTQLLNDYAAKATVTGNNTVVDLSNERIAKSIFQTQAGQSKKLAQIVAAAAQRKAGTSAEPVLACDVKAKAAQTGLSEDVVKTAYGSGLLADSLCVDTGAISLEGDRNRLEAAAFAVPYIKNGMSKDEALAEGLIKAVANDNAAAPKILSKEQALLAVHHLQEPKNEQTGEGCNVFLKAANQ